MTMTPHSFFKDNNQQQKAGNAGISNMTSQEAIAKFHGVTDYAIGDGVRFKIGSPLMMISNIDWPTATVTVVYYNKVSGLMVTLQAHAGLLRSDDLPDY